MLDMSDRALEMKMTKAAHSAIEEALRDENRQQQQYSVAPFQQHGYVSAFPQYPHSHSILSSRRRHHINVWMFNRLL
jgi:hypothetical protein